MNLPVTEEKEVSQINYFERLKKIGFTKIMFILPALLVILSLLVYPTFSSLYYSLTSKHLIRADYDFLWLDNFKYVLSNKDFYRAFLNSIKWTVLSIGGQVLVGFLAALSLNKIRRFSGLYRTLLIIPWAFPAIITALAWKWILNGVNGFLPNLLIKMGITEQGIDLLSNPSFAFWVAILINIWFGAPLFMVNILSALKTIPMEQYEAAHIDGANAFQSFWHITVRHVRIVIGSLLIVRTIWVFNNFEIMYLLTGGGPAKLTETLPIFAYKTGWDLKQLGVASAITVILLLFLVGLCSIFFKLLDKWEREDH